MTFNATESNKIILPSTLLENTQDETNCYLDDHPQLLNFGILKSYDNKPTGKQTQAEKQHYFIHLSFQEHFAARHLLKTLKSSDKQKAINFINNHKYDQRFQLVFIFASGLLTQSEYTSCMGTFWATIEGEPYDLVGLKHIKLIIECVDELGHQAVFYQRAHFLKDISQWLHISVRANAFAISEHLSRSLNRTNSLLNKPRIQNTLLQLMTTSDIIIKSKVFQFISTMTISDPTPKLLSTIHAALQDQDSDARQNVSEALGNMGEKAATNEVIAGFLNALRDQDYRVRQNASEALGNMGEIAATNEVIADLLNALRDEESYVRTKASEALGKIGEKSVTTAVIVALLQECTGRFADEMRDVAADAFAGAMCSYDVMKQLDSNMVLQLNSCIRLVRFIELRRVCVQRLIEVFMETRNDAWLPVIRYVTLVQGIAITIVGNRIKIHDVKEVPELYVTRVELIETFVNGVKNHDRDLRGDCIPVTEAED